MMIKFEYVKPRYYTYATHEDTTIQLMLDTTVGLSVLTAQDAATLLGGTEDKVLGMLEYLEKKGMPALFRLSNVTIGGIFLERFFFTISKDKVLFSSLGTEFVRAGKLSISCEDAVLESFSYMDYCANVVESASYRFIGKSQVQDITDELSISESIVPATERHLQPAFGVTIRW